MNRDDDFVRLFVADEARKFPAVQTESVSLLPWAYDISSMRQELLSCPENTGRLYELLMSCLLIKYSIFVL